MIAAPEGRLEWLAELAVERMRLVNAGVLDLHDAVDGLQYLAAAWGLVNAVGQDAVQKIIATPFRVEAEKLGAVA